MKKIIFLSTIFLLLATSVHAQSVDILWQGDTYTPPFYQGKSLWSTQSMITFVAIPNGLGNPSNLYYKWIRNGTVLGNSNGVGKNTLVFLDDILSRTQNIEVEIISASDNVLASSSISVTPIVPTLAVYENNPLYGFMFHKAVGENYRLKENELTLSAFPYFFNADTRLSNNLTYEWRTNTGGLGIRNSVTYRAPDNASGSSQVSLRVSNKNYITQNVEKGFLVEFVE